MKQIFSKRLAVLFASLFLAGAVYTIVKACAGGDWGSWFSSDFAPEAFVDKAYTPFFYDDESFYYDGYDKNHNYRFNDDNVAAWNGYLAPSDTAYRKLIGYLLYKTNSKTNKALADFSSSKGTSLPVLPDSLLRGIKPDWKGPRFQQFLKYLLCARQCEDFAVREIYYYWDYDNQKELPAENAPLLQTLTANFLQANASGDKFLSERYWFQRVRYNFFYNQPEAVKLFEQYSKAFSPNTLYYRTMAYAAGALYKQGEYGKANYYYSLVFAGSDALKTVAHFSFHPQEEADWQQTLALCQNNTERATLWQMLGIFYDDEMRSMKEIYAIAPESNKLDVLLVRKVNAIEMGAHYFWGYIGEKEQNDSIKKAYERDASWIFETTRKGLVQNKFLWNSASGYLASLLGNYAGAESFFAQARTLLPEGQLPADQLRMLELINQVGQLKTISATDEDRLLPELEWLFDRYDHGGPAGLRTNHATEWVRNTLSTRYAKQGELAKAECFQHKPDNFVTDEKTQAILRYLEAPSTRGYDRFCKELGRVKKEDVYSYQAVLATFDDKIELAESLMEKASDSDAQFYGNPFNGKIKDCHDCDHAARQTKKYSKLEFLQTIRQMKANLVNNSDVYNNALLLGNAFYNITHYGNGRMFYASEIIYDGSTPWELNENFRGMLTDNSLSVKYYTIALHAAQNDEQRAKCVYMLAKCERNQWYNDNYFTDRGNQYYNPSENEQLPDFIRWKNFEELEKYRNTQYYQELIRECGYFAKVAGR